MLLINSVNTACLILIILNVGAAVGVLVNGDTVGMTMVELVWSTAGVGLEPEVITGAIVTLRDVISTGLVVPVPAGDVSDFDAYVPTTIPINAIVTIIDIVKQM